MRRASAFANPQMNCDCSTRGRSLTAPLRLRTEKEQPLLNRLLTCARPTQRLDVHHFNLQQFNTQRLNVQQPDTIEDTESIQRTASMFDKSVPDWLVGVWHRLSIEEFSVDGHIEKDTTTQVFWLQTDSGFADIRIPADRPAVKSFDSLTSQQAIALSKQDGFAGITRSDGIICEWHHAMDYRPFKGQMDIGRMSWKDGIEGGILVEIGPDNAYREEWQWIGGGATATLTLSEASAWKGWLVVCGDFFICMRDRRQLLPAADSLTALVNRASSETYASYLSCEISYGYCQKGQKPWEIKLSTFPWREGESLWHPETLIVDEQHQQVVQSEGDEQLVWTVQNWGALAQLLPV